MKRFLTLLLSASLFTAPFVVLPLMTGCSTLGGDNAQHIQTSVKLAAYLGTQAYLTKNPQTRPGFVIARDELLVLSTAESIDAVTLLAIVNRLPIKELKGDKSSIFITASTIILSDYAGQLQLDQLKQLQPIAKSMAEGITLGLGTP